MALRPRWRSVTQVHAVQLSDGTKAASCQCPPPPDAARRPQSISKQISADFQSGSSALFKLVTPGSHAARIMVHLRRPFKRRCAGERSLSFGARSWCDVPAADSNVKPAAACRARRMVQAFLRSVSLGRRRSTRASSVHAPCRAGCGRVMLFHRRTLRRRVASLFHAGCGRVHSYKKAPLTKISDDDRASPRERRDDERTKHTTPHHTTTRRHQERDREGSSRW